MTYGAVTYGAARYGTVMRGAGLLLVCWLLVLGGAWAQTPPGDPGLRGLVRLTPEASTARDRRFFGTSTVVLGLSQGAPHRIYTLRGPNRLVVEVRGLDPAGFDAAQFDQSRRVTDLRMGRVSADWTRLVLVLSEPMAVDRAGMTVDPATQAATLSIRLKRTEQAAFDATAGAPAAVGVSEGVSEDVAAALSSATGPKGADVAGDLFADQAPRRILRVMLDPGHGGIDPGAQRDGVNESALMLAMARDVQEVLRRAGGFEVILTRDADVFVSLDKRVSMAQRAGADVFISLHADALAEGRAEGATIYTLSEEASDKASAALAARHDRSEILSGVNLGGTGADVAEALLDLARQETQPRADRLAAQMVLGIETSVGRVNARPLRRAGFSVLKSADIPSVLIEVGFLSTQADLRALQDPQWRERFATGIRDGLQAWALDDAARQAVQRQ